MYAGGGGTYTGDSVVTIGGIVVAAVVVAVGVVVRVVVVAAVVVGGRVVVSTWGRGGTVTCTGSLVSTFESSVEHPASRRALSDNEIAKVAARR